MYEGSGNQTMAVSRVKAVWHLATGVGIDDKGGWGFAAGAVCCWSKPQQVPVRTGGHLLRSYQPSLQEEVAGWCASCC